MKLTRRTPGTPDAAAAHARSGVLTGTTVDRRAFLKHSGLTAGGAALAIGGGGMVTKARAAEKDIAPKAGVETVTARSVCTHCSVGCGVIAEVQNGVWTGQEPDYDSPINTSARTAPRVPRCASTATASAG